MSEQILGALINLEKSLEKKTEKLEQSLRDSNKDLRMDLKETYSSLIELKLDVGRINEHLKTLNGKVVKQELRLSGCESEIMNNKISTTKIAGIIAGASTVTGIIFSVLKAVGLL